MAIFVRIDPAVKAHVTARGKITQDSSPCPVCDIPLDTGPVSLVYVGRPDKGSFTGAAVAVHDECAD